MGEIQERQVSIYDLKKEEQKLQAQLKELEKVYQIELRKIEAQKLRHEFNEQLIAEQQRLIELKKKLETIPLKNEYLHQISHYQRL